MLGLGLALTVGVLNAIWFEVSEDRRLTEPQAPGAGEQITGN